MSKRQRVEQTQQGGPLGLFLLSNEGLSSHLDVNLRQALASKFNLLSGSFDDFTQQFPDPATAPLVFIGTLSTDSFLDVISQLDHRGYRRTGASIQAMCMVCDKAYFGTWAVSRGIRKPPPTFPAVSLSPKTSPLLSPLPFPVLLKHAMNHSCASPVACHTYGELTTALQQSSGQRSVIEHLIQGPVLNLRFIAGHLTAWFEVSTNLVDGRLVRALKGQPLFELPATISNKIHIFRAFAQEMGITDDVLSFDVQLENESRCVHALEAHVGSSAVFSDHFTVEESETYCQALCEQALRPFSPKIKSLYPSDCVWEVVVEGEKAQHAYEGELEVTRTVLGVSSDSWHVHWVKSPEDIKTEPHAVSSVPSSPLQPAFALSTIMRDLVHSARPAKPRCLWFLYDYNDGAAQLQWLSEQAHDMILIAPSVESYRVSSSKTAMKRCFVRDGVPTAPFTDKLLTDPADFLDCPPWFVKPDGSFASIGIYTDNKVNNPDDMRRIWERTEKFESGVFAEHFLRGRECTVLVSGKIDSPVVFNPVERVFSTGLSGHQEDNNWDNFHFISLQDGDPWGEACKVLACAAYRSIDAAPYARIDIRGHFVLEVNTVPAYSLTDLAYSLAKSLNGEPKNWKKFWKSVWEARK